MASALPAEVQCAAESIEELSADLQLGARALLERAGAAGLPLASLPLHPVVGSPGRLQSRLGGPPMLSSPHAWPTWTHDDDQRSRRLEFIGQVRLDGLPRLSTLQLPKRGLLSFFSSAYSQKTGHSGNQRFEAAVLYTEDVGDLRPIEAHPVPVVDLERFLGLHEPPRAVGLEAGEPTFSFPPEFVAAVEAEWCGDAGDEHLVPGCRALAAAGSVDRAFHPSGVGVRLGGALRFSNEQENPSDWRALPRSILHVSAFGPGWTDELRDFGRNRLEWLEDGFFAFVTDPATCATEAVTLAGVREVHEDLHRWWSS